MWVEYDKNSVYKRYYIILAFCKLWWCGTCRHQLWNLEVRLAAMMMILFGWSKRKLLTHKDSVLFHVSLFLPHISRCTTFLIKGISIQLRCKKWQLQKIYQSTEKIHSSTDCEWEDDWITYKNYSLAFSTQHFFTKTAVYKFICSFKSLILPLNLNFILFNYIFFCWTVIVTCRNTYH